MININNTPVTSEAASVLSWPVSMRLAGRVLHTALCCKQLCFQSNSARDRVYSPIPSVRMVPAAVLVLPAHDSFNWVAAASSISNPLPDEAVALHTRERAVYKECILCKFMFTVPVTRMLCWCAVPAG